MTGNRQSRTWIWLAVAAITAVSLAPGKTGLSAVKALPSPVLAFLSGHPMSAAPSASRLPGMRVQAVRRQLAISSPRSSGTLWLAVVPVLFIGLIAPLSLVPSLTPLCPGRHRAFEPLFQRPPPAL